MYLHLCMLGHAERNGWVSCPCSCHTQLTVRTYSDLLMRYNTCMDTVQSVHLVSCQVATIVQCISNWLDSHWATLGNNWLPLSTRSVCAFINWASWAASFKVTYHELVRLFDQHSSARILPFLPFTMHVVTLLRWVRARSYAATTTIHRDRARLHDHTYPERGNSNEKTVQGNYISQSTLLYLSMRMCWSDKKSL